MKKKHLIAMLPTHQALTTEEKSNALSMLEFGLGFGYQNGRHQYLYVLSEEPIKRGEWIIASNNTNGVITDFNGCVPVIAKSDYAASIYVLKIIATTNPDLQAKQLFNTFGSDQGFSDGIAKIPQNFIKEYKVSYNLGKQLKEIELEYVEKRIGDEHDEFFYQIPKLTSDNEVIIWVDDIKEAAKARNGYSNKPLIGNPRYTTPYTAFNHGFEAGVNWYKTQNKKNDDTTN